jgi:putative hydrolase of the HAD superfamily
MVRAILFDVGDTLLDFAPMKTSTVVAQGARESYERLKQTGAKLPSLAKYRRGNVAAVRRALIWSHLRNREFSALRIMRDRALKLGAPNDEELLLELGWLWYKAVVDYSTVEPDVIPTLKLWRDAGLKLGVVSNTCVGGPVLDRHLKLMGLIEYFPVRVYSCEVGYRKPHPRIFQEAISLIGEKPQDILFIGDLVKKDIIGAGRMGMRTALRQPRSHERKHPIADYVIRRISELTPVVLPSAETHPRRETIPQPAIHAAREIAQDGELAGQTS